MNDAGGVVDDVIVYRVKPEAFFICVNAANIEKDFSWLCRHAGAEVEVENQSAMYAQLALQGPAALAILQPLTAVPLGDVKYFHFAFADVAHIRCMVARTGYTGEDGFELYVHVDAAEPLWHALLAAGEPAGLVPVGLGARDTLRLEAAYPLYGHELDDTTTPLEAGLTWVAKLTKPEFLGRDVLLQQKAVGLKRKLVGFEMLEPGIARSGYPVFKHDRSIGKVTSGTKSPSLGKAIALAYVDKTDAEIGNVIDVEIRGRRLSSQIVQLPFYRRSAVSN
jgi:aminomethyltransferase